MKKKLLFSIIISLMLMSLVMHRETTPCRPHRLHRVEYHDNDCDSIADDVDECVCGRDTVVVYSWEEDHYELRRDDDGCCWLVQSGRRYGISEDEFRFLTPSIMGLEYLEVKLRRCIKHKDCWCIDHIKEF